MRPGWLRRCLTPVTAVCLFLGLWGCLAIFNASAHYDNPLSYVLRQLVWLSVAMSTLGVASLLSVTVYRVVLPAMAVVSYAMLWLVLEFGVRVNGMQGWFSWNGLYLQPGELAKPAFLLSLAWLMERLAAQRCHLWKGYVPLLLFCGVWCLPIVLEPDFGTFLIYVITFVVVAWVMGSRSSHLVWTAAAAVPVAGLCVMWKAYLWHRLQGYWEPDAFAETYGWHVVQFQRTLASGGLWGNSLGHGVWSESFLPLSHSDSIFASIAEAVGFAGVVPLILLIIGWAYYGFKRAAAAGDEFSRAAILGLVAMLTIQSLMHLSVNLGLVPPTGITLPLISYGGSSLVSSLLMVGIVEGISRSVASRRSGDTLHPG